MAQHPQWSTRAREFFYVDVQRARSLLAQISGGVAEQVKGLKEDTVEAEAQARILGFGGRGGYGHTWGAEESRSLQDMAFAMFEDAADQQLLMRDLDDFFYDSSAWADGTVHAALSGGETVRVSCDLQVVDGGLFRKRLERMSTMADALSVLSGATDASSHATRPPPKAQKGGRPQKAAPRLPAVKSLLGVSQEYLEGIADFIENFVGEGIAMRALPCGEEFMEYSFGGTLLGRAEYIQEERDQLFSVYGSIMRGWTAVLQIAAVPRKEDQVSSIGATDWTLADGGISRAKTERGAIKLLSMLEGIGISEGPRHPSISVTPLGIYRDVPSQEVGGSELDSK